MMPLRGLVLAACLAAVTARANEGAHFVGDLGLGVQCTRASTSGTRARTWLLPYAYGDLGRLFIREDTLGAKLLPIGWGALELVGRVSTEGSEGDGSGLAHRTNPRPLGIGTFQETPWGGVFADAFVDSVSGGTLVEASYAAELPVGPWTLYPQAGLTRRSARYDAHLYDVHASSTTPVLQISGELPFADTWVTLAHVQWEPFGRALRESPRVTTPARVSALVAIAWRFR